jgi:5,10-methylenetetrahydrofolate reductase
MTELGAVLGKRFVITVEMDPPKGPDLSDLFQQAEMLKGRVDAVNIADSPMARMRMTPIAQSCLIRQRIGLDTIFHMTCRDRNLLGLQSELLGAWAMGVKNFLALTGDPPAMGDHPEATGVFDVDAVGLVKLAAGLNEGQDMAGNRLNGRTGFLIGAAVNPLASDLDKEVSRFRSKAAAGAVFTQTQPVYDPPSLTPFLQETSDLGVHCLAGILPIKSHRMLRYLDENVPGIIIPGKVRDRIMGVPPEKVREESITMAAEIIGELEEMKGALAGVHIMPVGDYSMVPDLLEKLEKRR